MMFYIITFGWYLVQIFLGNFVRIFVMSWVCFVKDIMRDTQQIVQVQINQSGKLGNNSIVRSPPLLARRSAGLCN